MYEHINALLLLLLLLLTVAPTPEIPKSKLVSQAIYTLSRKALY